MSNRGLNAKFKQGLFVMKNPEKYKGKTPPFYRSSYEFAFMCFCDRDENVLEWSSESNIVNYICPTDGKRHAYWVDNYVKLKTDTGVKKYLVEVKPHKFTLPPVSKGKRKSSSLLYEQATYIKNQAKWLAAKKYAEEYGMEFMVITEKHLAFYMPGR